MLLRLLVALLFGPDLCWDDAEWTFDLTAPHFAVSASVFSPRLA